MSAKRGFTLVELMIVVSLLALVATLVVCQFSTSTEEARMSALNANLSSIRKQIEVYRNQHEGQLPAFVGETGDDFARRMTTRTDMEGNPGGRLGPYVMRMPFNPYNRLFSVRIGDMAPGAGTHGWRFNPLTGEFQSDDNLDKNRDGVPDHVRL